MRYDPYSKVKISKFIKKGIVIDTGILYLFFIGWYDLENETEFLKKFNYNHEDFETLSEFQSSHAIKKYYVTPHIFSEFYLNVKKHLPPIHFERFNRRFLLQFHSLSEKHIHKNDILAHPEFLDYKLGDVSIIISTHNLSEKHNKFAYFTADHKLVKKYEKHKKILALHFEDIKAYKYSFTN